MSANEHEMSDSGLITAKGIEDLRSWLGVPRPTRGWNNVASEDAIWHFAQGVGDDNPLWWDREYAEGTRWARMFAMPAFPYSCSSGGIRVGEDGIFPAESWLPGTISIWVSDRWVFHRAAWEGERVVATSELVSVEERARRDGSPAVTHVDKTSYMGSDGSMIAECYKTLNRYERREQESAPPPEAPETTYTDAEIRVIEDQYDSEPAARRGAITLYGDDLAVGESLPTIVKGPMTITNIVGFVMGWGSPMCQTNRIVHQYLREHPRGRLTNPRMNIGDTLEGPHWDPLLARQNGMAACYDFGAQRICWMAHLLTDWCGDDGVVTALEASLRRPNFVGDTTWISGTVTAKDRQGDSMLVDCALAATNQRGEETAIGKATVRLPAR